MSDSYVQLLAPREVPDDQRVLLAAHDRLLREIYAFYAAATPPLESISQKMTYALFARLIQQARALHVLIRTGYADEGQSVGGALVNTAVTMVAIIDADSDSRALQYLTHSQFLRRRQLDGYIERGVLPEGDANTWDAGVREKEAEILASYHEHGVDPKPVADERPRDDTWHGLSERGLFDKMNAMYWYDMFYRAFSEEVHAAVSSVAPALRTLQTDMRARVGPAFDDPWRVVMASGDCLVQCAAQLNDFLGWDRRSDLEPIKKRIEDAVNAHLQILKGKSPESLRLIDPSADE